MDLNRYREDLEQRKKEGMERILRRMELPAGPTARVDGEIKHLFCSNNYLGLANHPAIIQAVQKAAEQWGLGCGGSRLICGNTAEHEDLEKAIASWLGKEACLIFPSGYQTNYSVLSTLPQEGDLVLVDKLVHASILDGLRASKANLRSFPHKQYARLRQLLRNTFCRQAWIVTESLFSMDGDLADLRELVRIKQEFSAALVVDEAHALGCFGPRGEGYAAQTGLLEHIDLFIGTFSKAFGLCGGFVACPATIRNYLINRARGFIFSTGIPAVHCAAARAALQLIQEDPARRDQLWENVRYFHGVCRDLGLETGGSESYIVPIQIGEATKTKAVSEMLWKDGYWAPAIRPPAVAPGTSRLRISLMSEHTREAMEGLAVSVRNALRNLG